VTRNDQAAGVGRILSSIRDVLFENSSPPSVPPETHSGASTAPASSDVEAARSVLRTAIEAQLGPSVREFSLQDRALADALPDGASRRKAILRVLALKGSTREQLCAELANALGTLTAQGDTFAHKLNERRAALAQSGQTERQRCAEDTSAAERAIARLQTELEAQRALITEAVAQRDRQIAEIDATLAELNQRERAFECAFREVERDYVSLHEQLSRESA